ncbi:MOSC domain-containing protein [Candidatus Aerophobetes bacterium]|nr:MOSC domain-containing protein [Candidatus Aerophobetes bacterium]
MEGRIISINISREKGTSKKPVERAYLRRQYGILGDAHAGKWHRQVSLLSWESVKKFTISRKISREFHPGDFAENITVDIDLSCLKIGDCIKLGSDVLIKVTQIGKKCHRDCAIYKEIGKCLMPEEGIFAEVLEGGEIRIGDKIKVVNDENRNNYGK